MDYQPSTIDLSQGMKHTTKNRKYITIILVMMVFVCRAVSAQDSVSSFYGYRKFSLSEDKFPIDILVRSRKGEELVKKPVFFFCQGSLPIPLILLQDSVQFGTFSFNADLLTDRYHIVVVSKPAIPLVADIKRLNPDYTYFDSLTRQFPRDYDDRDNLDYYVNRNEKIIKFLRSQSWVSKSELVVAGHSEGAAIALKMSSVNKLITHLIYSGGNPFGRLMSIVARGRASETNTASDAEDAFKSWKEIISKQKGNYGIDDVAVKSMNSFSKSAIEMFEKIRIPVLVSYGSKDHGAVHANDFLRFKMMKKENFTFQCYQGKEHNYFSFLENGEIDYNDFNWDNVVTDWVKWLNNNKK